MDDKLRAVVANWSARFVANEIDALDVERTMADVATWDDWADAWERLADRYADLADEATAAGHRITAAAHRRRAALVLQFGQFVLNDDPTRREAMHRRQAALYALAAPDLDPPAVPYRLRLPALPDELEAERRGHGAGGEVEVLGYVRLPRDRGPGPVPTVVLVPGLESTKEQFTTYEPYLLDRGIATVTMEGPGQGEGWYAHPFALPAFRRAFAAVLAHVDGHPDLAGAPLAVIGTSFGGFLSLRCAADHADRLAAVVDIAGPHTLTPLGELQPVLQEGFVHLTGARDVAHADAILTDVTLTGSLERLAGLATLVVHGDQDRIIPVEHGDRIVAEHPGPVTYDRVVGGTHSANNLHTIVRPRIADWVADALATPPSGTATARP